jgi:hypothetical protein
MKIRKKNSLMVSEIAWDVINMELNGNVNFADEDEIGWLDTFDNCRETGLMLHIIKDWNKCIWIYQHRSSDDIVVTIGDTEFNNMYSEDAWHNSEHFRCGRYDEVADYVINEIEKIIANANKDTEV